VLTGSDADLTLYATKARLMSARASKPIDMESTELLRPALDASECGADAIRQNQEVDNANVSAMNKAKIIAELENMVVARLFSRQPWLADRETISAYHRRLIQMGLVEQVRAEPPTWQITDLGKELNVNLFQVFIGLFAEWEIPSILEEYGLLHELEAEAILERMSEANAERLLSGYVKRAYLDYRKASKFLH
jgi:hypothetical protein